VQAQADYIAHRSHRTCCTASAPTPARAWPQLKQQHRVQTYDDLIDGVADALDGEKGDALARQLRSQYAVPWSTNSRDTDARQWRSSTRVRLSSIEGTAI
jgi:hypothetical protein